MTDIMKEDDVMKSLSFKNLSLNILLLFLMFFFLIEVSLLCVFVQMNHSNQEQICLCPENCTLDDSC